MKLTTKDKKLIKRLLSRIKKRGTITYGLCHEILVMYVLDYITPDEDDRLSEIVYDFRPRKNKYHPYYWESGNIKPRIKFLEKILNMNNKK